MIRSAMVTGRGRVFEVAGSPTGFELVGGLIGLVLGTILGAFYGGALALPRTSHRHRDPTSNGDRSR